MPKTIHHLSERSKLRSVFSIFSVLAIAAAAGCVSVPEKKADSSAPNAAQTSPNPVVSTPQTKRVPTAEGTWLKDLTSGCKVWTAIKNANLSVRWYGPCEDGLAHGMGKLEAFISGELDGTYVGRMTDGLLHGKGQYTFKNGSKFEGSYVDGFRDGNGKYTHPNGYEFQGNYFKGSPSGLGVQKEPNGTRYEGGFLNGKRSGAGTLYYTNGSGYKGNFVDGKPVGLFKSTSLVDADKNYEFKDGKFITASAPAGALAVASKDQGAISNSPDRPNMFRAFQVVNDKWTGRTCDFEYPLNDDYRRDGLRSDTGFVWRGLCLNGLLDGTGDLLHGAKDGNGNLSRVYSTANYPAIRFTAGKQVGPLVYGAYGTNVYSGEAANFYFTGVFRVVGHKCLDFWNCNGSNRDSWDYGVLWKSELVAPWRWNDDTVAIRCNNLSQTPAQCRWAATTGNTLDRQIQELQRTGQCNALSKIVDDANSLGGMNYSKSGVMKACTENAKFFAVVDARDPQAMFLSAGQYESTGERGRAKTIYNSIISKFPKSPIAVQATNRLTALADVEAVESAGNRAAQASRDAAASVRTQNYEQCVATENSCYSRCDSLKDSSSRSSCRNGCYKGCNK